jgi:hypothetical protein
MAPFSSKLRLAGLLFVAALLLTGCNPYLLPYLLHGEAKEPASFHQLASKDKQVKVVIISRAPGAEGTPLGVGADRELCRKLTRQLFEITKSGGKEKIDLVAPRSVDKFKDEHPDWYKMDLKVVGQYFKADYVVFLEMDTFDLYENGGLMYRGRTEISVTLQDMHDATGEPDTKIYKTEYPKERCIPSDDANVNAFRDKFLDHVATELTWMFAPHDTCSGIAEE